MNAVSSNLLIPQIVKRLGLNGEGRARTVWIMPHRPRQGKVTVPSPVTPVQHPELLTLICDHTALTLPSSANPTTCPPGTAWTSSAGPGALGSPTSARYTGTSWTLTPPLCPPLRLNRLTSFLVVLAVSGSIYHVVCLSVLYVPVH
jgi:hypothetical protein